MDCLSFLIYLQHPYIPPGCVASLTVQVLHAISRFWNPYRPNSVFAGSPERNTDLIPVYIITARYIGTCERCGRAVKEINQPVVLSERSLFSSPVSETEAASEQHTDHILPPTPSPLSLTNTPLFLRHSIGGDIALCCGAVGRKIREKAETLQKVMYIYTAARFASALPY